MAIFIQYIMCGNRITYNIYKYYYIKVNNKNSKLLPPQKHHKLNAAVSIL